MKKRCGNAGHEPVWRPAARLRHGSLPPHLAAWLLDTGSLTRRLKAACTMGFRVEVRHQGWAVPMACEARALGLAPRRRAMVREVVLWCGASPWVFARTVIPARTLRGRGRRLAFLGNRPLGEVLFSDPQVTRGPLEVGVAAAAVLGCDHPQRAVWGRRSVFRLGVRPLLVSEFFIGALPQRGDGPSSAGSQRRG